MAKTEPRDRIKRLLVTVNTSERNIIQNHAAACSLSVSSYLRALGVGHEPKSTVDLQAISELAAARADLGQLAGLMRQCLTQRSGDGVLPSEVRGLIQKIEMSEDEVRARIRAL